MAKKNETERDLFQEDAPRSEEFEVLRREFTPNLSEPSITFTCEKVYVNKACLKCLPNVDHVKFLIHRRDLKLRLEPSCENERDSMPWCARGGRREPRHIGGYLPGMVMDFMGWNPEHRYRLLGKPVCIKDKQLLDFDLTIPMITPRATQGKTTGSRIPLFQGEWQKQFGLTVEEHRKRFQVKIFNGHTVFRIQTRNDPKPPSGENPP